MTQHPDHSNALERGKAAEHYVCYDLIKQGYQAFLSDQGLPFDVCVDVQGGLRKIQVKSTQVLRETSYSSGLTYSYVWNFIAGRRHNRLYKPSDCDYIACVAIDLERNIRKVAYIPSQILEGQKTISLAPMDDNDPSRNHFSDFTFQKALAGETIYKKANKPLYDEKGQFYETISDAINKTGYTAGQMYALLEGRQPRARNSPVVPPAGTRFWRAEEIDLNNPPWNQESNEVTN